MTTFTRKPKQGKALWVGIKDKTFQAQHAKLHPERSPANNLRARSATEAQRMAVYNAIKELYLAANRCCCACVKLHESVFAVATEIHHKHSRDGILLFDVRNWVGLCSEHHRWIHEHPDKARKIGLLAPKGKWGKID